MKKLFDEIPRLENGNIIIKEITSADAEALHGMTQSSAVYRYLPTFLFEKSCPDTQKVIRELYRDIYISKESLILGIYTAGDMQFCGIAEFYGFKDQIHKTCIGYRLSDRFWGKGIATQTVALMVDYLYTQTDTEIITASTMVENLASARVLEKNGFIMTAASVPEDWGFPEPTTANKWFR